MADIEIMMNCQIWTNGLLIENSTYYTLRRLDSILGGVYWSVYCICTLFVYASIVLYVALCNRNSGHAK